MPEACSAPAPAPAPAGERAPPDELCAASRTRAVPGCRPSGRGCRPKDRGRRPSPPPPGTAPVLPEEGAKDEKGWIRVSAEPPPAPNPGVLGPLPGRMGSGPASGLGPSGPPPAGGGLATALREGAKYGAASASDLPEEDGASDGLACDGFARGRCGGVCGCRGAVALPKGPAPTRHSRPALTGPAGIGHLGEACGCCPMAELPLGPRATT
mmetsp:Transcript_100518/g.255744  ORF Transcript_100518/g.255744 Transcript_100518/m.255744 type:complete len:211 (+) Transcript_100518:374-1006(+)